ncbi:MAG TPA: hypothetical protein VM030_07035 [Acidimicrobiales bacterium]|nr:hypothetical protein [Acidimicrobiales bacterium]
MTIPRAPRRIRHVLGLSAAALVVTLGPATSAAAHPGPVDATGGHFCEQAAASVCTVGAYHRHGPGGVNDMIVASPPGTPANPLTPSTAVPAAAPAAPVAVTTPGAVPPPAAPVPLAGTGKTSGPLAGTGALAAALGAALVLAARMVRRPVVFEVLRPVR